MPLDGHSYLVAQGWSGKGAGLRQGAISKPLSIPQKKNLSGLGKDRDEAFPFWDHLFTAAANTIKIKVTSDDEDEDNLASSSAVPFKRTSTGILSNRRPVTGTAANSGNTTPESEVPRYSLLANAKREAAKRGLYSRFFRGPILGPHEVEASPDTTLKSSSYDASQSISAQVIYEQPKKKRKTEDDAEGREERRDRKRRKKELKEAEAVEKNRVMGKLQPKGTVSAPGMNGLEDERARKERKRAKKEARRKVVNVGGNGELEAKETQKRATEDQVVRLVTPVDVNSAPGKKSKKKRRDKSQVIDDPEAETKRKKRKRDRISSSLVE